jgi:hypothetical protein
VRVRLELHVEREEHMERLPPRDRRR